MATTHDSKRLSTEIYHKPYSLIGCVLNTLQSIPIRAMAVGIVYMTGYFKVNPVWIMIAWGWFKYRDQKNMEKLFKRKVAMAVALRNDREMVLANVDPTPSWVYFPDTERCEWINKVIRHLWPSVRPFMLDYIVNTFEPSINEVLKAYKEDPNFSLKKSSLGTVTPRISGIRVYRKGSHDQVILDMYLFFSSDSTLTFSLMNAVGGFECFKIKGCLRTIILPVTMSDVSLIGGVELFFVRQPKIDFTLAGVLEVFGIPALNGILRKTIDRLIYEKLVLPNKILVKLNEKANLKSLKFPDPVGFLSINIIEAQALMESNRFVLLGSKYPNAYVTVNFGEKTTTSQVVENSINPVWNFWANFIIDSFFDDTITISVDCQKGNLGKVSLGLALIEDKNKFDSWIQLEGVATGMVHVRVYYYQLDNNPELLTSSNVPAILEVFINEAKNLVTNRKIRRSVALLYIGEITYKSKPVPVENPVFEENFVFIVKNPKTETLRIKLMDESGKIVLGETDFELEHLLAANNLEVIDKLSKLDSENKKAALSFSLRLRYLKVA